MQVWSNKGELKFEATITEAKMRGWTISDDWLIYRPEGEQDLHLIDFLCHRHHVIQNLDLGPSPEIKNNEVY